MKATAFSPAHITGFFEPCFNPNNLHRSGSRGAGFCLSLGALSNVELIASNQQANAITINGTPHPAPVTTLGISQLLGSQAIKVNVDITLDLPIGQGFGMSGAGTLSSCLAICRLLDLPEQQALACSHIAEVSQSTGLGDVVAQHFGGIEIRREPGLPPYGFLEHIVGSYEIVVCIIGEALSTTKILTDTQHVAHIKTLGKTCLFELLKKPTFETLVNLSEYFTLKSKLADNTIIDAITDCKKYGIASMCMLGNSLFAVGEKNQLQDILSQYGTTYSCNIETNGAHVLKSGNKL